MKVNSSLVIVAPSVGEAKYLLGFTIVGRVYYIIFSCKMAYVLSFEIAQFSNTIICEVRSVNPSLFH